MKQFNRTGKALAFHRSILLPTTALTLGLAAPAIAQNTEPRPAATTNMLEEVIVTARRREESVQDVPISISVFDQETLNERNVTNAADLANYTPSLNVNTRFGPDQASFSIRGFTQELRTTASVGVYFADVVAPRGGGSITAGDGAGPGAFFDLQNVQVLKGPQGTLFGRNTTGGAVLLVPQKPTYDLEGYIEGSGGDLNMQRAQGVINVPMGERARARFGVDYQKRDGTVDNVSGIGPGDMSDLNYLAARASLVVDLTDSIENYTLFTYTDSDNNGSPSSMFACNPNIVNGRRVGLATFCDAQWAAEPTSFYELESTMLEPSNTLKQWQGINTTTWMATDNLTVKNIIAYADLEQTTRTVVFGTDWHMPAALPGVGGLPLVFTNSDQVPGVPTNSQTSFVEEFQLQGRVGSQFNWQTGLYYENSKPDGWSGSQSTNQVYCPEVPGVDPATFRCQDVLRQATFFGVIAQQPALALVPGIINRFGATGNVQRQLGQVEYENKAVYAQGTYSISDQFKVTAGARYTWDETTGISQQTAYRGFNTVAASAPGALLVPSPQQLGALGLPFVPPPIPLQTAPAIACINTTASLADNCSVDLEQKSDAPTWLIDFDYLPNENVLLYAKYARGYRQGSVNLFGAEGFQTHEPEKVDAYEVGLKTEFSGAIPGTFNVAVFYNDLQDQQIQTGFQSSTGAASPTTGILNAGASTIQGVEVDTVLALFADLRLDLSYTYLDTKLEELVIPPAPPAGSIFDIRNPSSVQGEPLPLSPENKVSATLTYRLPLPETVGDLSMGINYSYTDEQITSSNSPYGTLPAYELVNLNLTWKRIAGSRFDASLFMTNALDEEYTVYVPGLYNSVGAEFRQVGMPKMWGGRLRYSFGGND